MTLILPAILTFSSLVAIGMVVYVLLCRADPLSAWERYGLSLIAAGFVLTIAPFLTEQSPFGIWSGCLPRFGVIMCIYGALRRVRGS